MTRLRRLRLLPARLLKPAGVKRDPALRGRSRQVTSSAARRVNACASHIHLTFPLSAFAKLAAIEPRREPQPGRHGNGFSPSQLPAAKRLVRTQEISRRPYLAAGSVTRV